MNEALTPSHALLAGASPVSKPTAGFPDKRDARSGLFRCA